MIYYLLQIVGTLRVILGFGIVAAILGELIGGAVISEYICDGDDVIFKKLSIVCLAVLAVSVLGLLFIPSEATLKAIIAAKDAAY